MTLGAQNVNVSFVTARIALVTERQVET